jgi:simple sugar transport system ATP-binding protein
MDLADAVTVLRQGKVALNCLTTHTHASALATTMIGRTPSPPTPWEKPTPKEEILNVKGLLLQDNPVELKMQQGEIVGIAGVEGNGQDALLFGILNPKHRTMDSIVFAGQDCRHFSARQMRQLGLGVIPHDRQKQGLILGQNLLQNFLLGQQNDSNWRRWGAILHRLVREKAAQALEEFDIRPANLDASASSLSGGNQQKWIVARELGRKPKLLLAAHPTRGVDIGAIESLHRHFISARNKGLSILLFSSDLDELMGIADRIYVLYRGQFLLHLQHDEFDAERIGKAMGGLLDG